MRAPRVTLLQVFAGSSAGLAVLLGALLLLFFALTRPLRDMSRVGRHRASIAAQKAPAPSVQGHQSP